MNCGKKIWKDFSSHRCGKPAKFYADLGGPVPAPLCGIHARVVKKHAKVWEIPPGELLSDDLVSKTTGKQA